MKNCYIIVLFLAVLAFAQGSKPNWVEESWRSADYPASEWYVGFAKDNVSGQISSEVYQSIERNAQNKLSESIKVKIQSTSSIESGSRKVQTSNNLDETISSSYKQGVQTQTDNVLIGVETKSWFDKTTNTIYGFAVVKKKDLASYYMGNINSLFAFANKEFELSGQLAEQDKKKLALEKLKVIEDSLKNVAFWGSLLQAVDGDNSYLEREKNLSLAINNAKLQFQNSTAIYLEVASNDDCSDFEERLAAQLQEKGCNCSVADTKEEANYLITVKSKLKECVINNSNSFVYCYTNATATVNNPKFKKPLSISIDEKSGWANGNKNKATEQSFKVLIEKLSTKIIRTMNQ